MDSQDSLGEPLPVVGLDADVSVSTTEEEPGFDDEDEEDFLPGLDQPSSPEPPHRSSTQDNLLQLSEEDFDHSLIQKMDKTEKLAKALETEPPVSADVAGLSESFVSELEREDRTKDISLTLTERHLENRKDWYFLRENSSFMPTDSWETFLYGSLKPGCSLEELLQSFGVPRSLLTDLHVSLDGYDPRIRTNALSEMCCQLSQFIKSPRFTECFISFILDRNIFNSVGCTSAWCTDIYHKIGPTKFWDDYFKIVPKEAYILHLRVSRQIHGADRMLFQKLHNTTSLSNRRLIKGFDTLLFAGNHQGLLYYTLFIYGIRPDDTQSESLFQAMRNRLQKSRKGQYEVELVILEGYLTTFLINR
ncbi:LAMI_0D02454g1_1 [Lachancea mirantina]|uniref:LAMI_0D02454g1_1 n=1 Tax=Lachancea mirantina TaxID=1230905 RepID=A0A1G4J969_9SACH|nr:LAMI_0D02454g1_1 [Lachancea mirantina]